MFLNKVKNNNFIFAIVLILLILFSSTNTWASLFINTPYEIGINSKNLSIGDRGFYINDDDPIKGEIGSDGKTFGGLEYKQLHGNPLYPNLLKIPSYISIIFGQSTSSKLWNSILIILTAVSAIFINFLIQKCGVVMNNPELGVIASYLFILCPYTYIFVLTGSISIYALLGTTITTYGVLDFFKSIKNNDNNLRSLFILTFGLIWSILIRPNGIALYFGTILIAIFYFLKTKEPLEFFKRRKKLLFLFLSFNVFLLALTLNQFFYTKEYIGFAIYDYSHDIQNFFGYPSNLLKQQIENLSNEQNIISNLRAIIYLLIWKISNFILGINDIRNSYTSLTLPNLDLFMIRIMTGTFYFLPMSTLSILSIIFLYKKLISKGLIICIFASFLSISPNLIGVALSRYYFCYLTPFLLAAALSFYELKKLDLNIKN